MACATHDVAGGADEMMADKIGISTNRYDKIRSHKPQALVAPQSLRYAQHPQSAELPTGPSRISPDDDERRKRAPTTTDTPNLSPTDQPEPLRQLYPKMPKQVHDIKQFIELCRRKDASCMFYPIRGGEDAGKEGGRKYCRNIVQARNGRGVGIDTSEC